MNSSTNSRFDFSNADTGSVNKDTLDFPPLWGPAQGADAPGGADRSEFEDMWNWENTAGDNQSQSIDAPNAENYPLAAATAPLHASEQTGLALPNEQIPKSAKRVFKCVNNAHGCGGVFPKNQTLLRHVARFTKKFTCELPECPRTSRQGERPSFGSKSDLKRHYTDIHQSKAFRCPYTSCDRHSNPFPRMVNLENHMKNRHPNTNMAETDNTDASLPPQGATGLSQFPSFAGQASPTADAVTAFQFAANEAMTGTNDDIEDQTTNKIRLALDSVLEERDQARLHLQKLDMSVNNLKTEWDNRLMRGRIGRSRPQRL